MKIVYVLLATAFFSLSAQAQTNDFLTRHGLSYCESVEQAKKCALNQQQVTTWVAGKKLVGKQTGYEGATALAFDSNGALTTNGQSGRWEVRPSGVLMLLNHWQNGRGFGTNLIKENGKVFFVDRDLNRWFIREGE